MYDLVKSEFQRTIAQHTVNDSFYSQVDLFQKTKQVSLERFSPTECSSFKIQNLGVFDKYFSFLGERNDKPINESFLFDTDYNVEFMDSMDTCGLLTPIISETNFF